MTTPLPSPTPFAELLKRATPGPFISIPDANFIVAHGGNVLAAIPEPDRELVLRLLSWAHAGGVEELREAERALRIISTDLAVGFDGKSLRASLALLDGKKEEA